MKSFFDLKSLLVEALHEVLPASLSNSGREAMSSSTIEPPREFISIKEVSVLTGYTISTLYGLVSKKKIPYVKRKGTKFLRFRRSDIMDWMAGKD